MSRKHGEPAEIRWRLFRSDGSERQLEAATDCFRDIAYPHTLFRHRVIFSVWLSLFERQTVEMRYVEKVRRRSAVESFADGRTPGLRREEVAQRAHISPTWYAWLEQGRGGAPSPDVLDRIAHALMLTDVEREHLFLLGLGRLPDARYRKSEGVTPRLQRVLDALDPSPGPNGPDLVGLQPHHTECNLKKLPLQGAHLANGTFG